MRKQLPIQIDLVAGTLAFIVAIFGVIAITSQIHWPWPVTAIRLIVNGLLILVLAGKIAEYVRIFPLFQEGDERRMLVIGSILSLITLIALFTTQHMGALSTLLFIPFCILGYIDIRYPKYATDKKN